VRRSRSERPRRGDPRQTLTFTSPGGTIRVTTAPLDSGQGIPPDHLAHIFDPFYRVTAGGARFELELPSATLLEPASVP